MRQRLRSVLCLFVLLLVLPPATASANGLPRPYARIEVNQLDQPLAYIAMLTSDEPVEPDEMDAPPPDIPAELTAALPDGWYVWWYQNKRNETLDHLKNTAGFYGTDMPETFRIALVMADGTAIVTGETTRTLGMQTFTVNAVTGAISTLGLWFGLFKQFLCTFIFTLLIELVVLLLFRFKLGENIGTFLLVNLATQAFMTLTYGRILLVDGRELAFFWSFAIEAVIFVVESLAYARFLHGHTRERRVAYAITANLLSFVIGALLITPFYTALAL